MVASIVPRAVGVSLDAFVARPGGGDHAFKVPHAGGVSAANSP